MRHPLRLALSVLTAATVVAVGTPASADTPPDIHGIGGGLLPRREDRPNRHPETGGIHHDVRRAAAGERHRTAADGAGGCARNGSPSSCAPPACPVTRPMDPDVVRHGSEGYRARSGETGAEVAEITFSGRRGSRA